MLHCKVFCDLAVLTFWKEFAIICYVSTEDTGLILLKLCSHLCKTWSVLVYESALVY